MSKYVPPQRRGRQKGLTEEPVPKSLKGKLAKLEAAGGLGEGEAARMTARSERFASSPIASPVEYGLPSRGEDTRLQDSLAERVAFFLRIRREFALVCLEEGLPEGWPEARLASDKQSQSAALSFLDGPPSLDGAPFLGITSTLGGVSALASLVGSMDGILMSLRKLREALVTLDQLDEFAKSVFLFSVRLAIGVGHPQTYVPSLAFLMTRDTLNPGCLTELEVYEIVTYSVLHHVHVVPQPLVAIQVHAAYSKRCPLLRKDTRLRSIMQSYTYRNYDAWFRFLAAESDPKNYALMFAGRDTMLAHFVLVVTASYFTLRRDALLAMLHHTCRWDEVERFIQSHKRLAAVAWRCHPTILETIIIKERVSAKREAHPVKKGLEAPISSI